MAARAMTMARAVAGALLAGLCLAAPPEARPAAEEKKVWRALTEGESRSVPPAVSPALPTSRGRPEAFPSELLLGLVVVGVIAAILAVGALQARRRPAPPAGRVPEETEAPEQGSQLEQLWRTHLRSKRPKPGAGV